MDGDCDAMKIERSHDHSEYFEESRATKETSILHGVLAFVAPDPKTNDQGSGSLVMGTDIAARRACMGSRVCTGYSAPNHPPIFSSP